jgi:hypothetical protein
MRRLPPSLATTVQSGRLARMEKTAPSSGAVDQAYRNASPCNSDKVIRLTHRVVRPC